MQISECFASEVKRAGDEDGVWLRPGRVQLRPRIEEEMEQGSRGVMFETNSASASGAEPRDALDLRQKELLRDR